MYILDHSKLVGKMFEFDPLASHHLYIYICMYMYTYSCECSLACTGFTLKLYIEFDCSYALEEWFDYGRLDRITTIK